MVLKANRYDTATDTLHPTPAETIAWQKQVGCWADYLQHPDDNGGLRPWVIADPAEIRAFSAFVAWASVANRPACQNHTRKPATNCHSPAGSPSARASSRARPKCCCHTMPA